MWHYRLYVSKIENNFEMNMEHREVFNSILCQDTKRKNISDVLTCLPEWRQTNDTISRLPSTHTPTTHHSTLRVRPVLVTASLNKLQKFKTGHFRSVRKIVDKRLLDVCPSVGPHGTTRLPMDGILWNFIFQDIFFFWKSVGKIEVSIISDKHKGYFTWKPIFFFLL